MLSRSKFIVVKAVIVAAALSASVLQEAQARESTRSFTCEALRFHIQTRGAVVMNTKNTSVYRRFVAHGGFCQFGEGVAYYSVPTKHGKCRLKVCVDIDYDDFIWRRR